MAVEHEPAVCLGSQEGQWYLGLYQQQCGQQDWGRATTLVVGVGEPMLQVLHYIGNPTALHSNPTAPSRQPHSSIMATPQLHHGRPTAPSRQSYSPIKATLQPHQGNLTAPPWQPYSFIKATSQLHQGNPTVPLWQPYSFGSLSTRKMNELLKQSNEAGGRIRK